MPTFGLVGRGGVLPNSYTFDHCGPLARSVEDCAIVMQVIAGFDPRDAGSIQRHIPEYRTALQQDLKGLRIGVLRHNWEEDLPASEDVRRAMEEALHVLKSLGAELEDCRVRSLQHYFDIKVIIAETEIFSIHQPDLIARPGDFGADFRARVLPAVLFTANDYVQATREHRQMVAEMAPLYRSTMRSSPRARAKRRVSTRIGASRSGNGQPVHRRQCHQPASAGDLQRFWRPRPAARDAGPRPPLRRRDGAPCRPCLRAGDRLASPASAAP